MDAEQLKELCQRFNENREFITNEESTKMALVVPFIRLLGYDTNNPREVRLEYAADFTQGDGKRFPDRMDFLIFDISGTKPLMAIEVKQLGTDLISKAQQLARYIAQINDLHFGIMTDGCRYLFYGDLENTNQMDRDPFFEFNLDDPKIDWTKVAKFLSKFSRENFNAETLVTDAENSRYRQAMIDKLAAALKSPMENEGFLKWLTADIYKGKRTGNVMTRMAELARESVEPALIRIMSDEFLAKLKERIQYAHLSSEISPGDELKSDDKSKDWTGEAALERNDASEESKKEKAETVTTQEELEAYLIVKEICKKDNLSDEIIYKDTVNYFNISYKRPTNWFVRFIARGSKKQVITLVPVDEAKRLVSGFEIEASPAVFGVSRVYIDAVPQFWALKDLIAKSLELSLAPKAKNGLPEAPATTGE